MKKLIYILFLFLQLSLYAQSNMQKAENKDVNKLIEKALNAYNRAEYTTAENLFRKALAKDPTNAIASYNLGLTQIEQNKVLEANRFFNKSAQVAKDKELKSKAFYNQGNIWYHKKKYDKAVEAYKNALRNNPNDEEARYNLALAQQKLKQQQKDKNKNNKNNKKKDNKNNKDKNKNQDKKQDKNQDKKNNKDKNKQQNNNNQQKDKQQKDKQDKKNQQQEQQKNDKQKDSNQQNKQQNQQPKESKSEQEKRKTKLTPQQVKQLLVALKNKEQKTQKKIKAKMLKTPSKKKKQGKDW